MNATTYSGVYKNAAIAFFKYNKNGAYSSVS